MEQNRRNRPRSSRAPLFSDEMPLGLSAALSQNPAALDRFQTLDEDEKRELMAGAGSIRSKEEMRSFVDAFAASGDGKTNISDNL